MIDVRQQLLTFFVLPLFASREPENEFPTNDDELGNDQESAEDSFDDEMR